MSDLDGQLLRAHEQGDRLALVGLYAEAAAEAEDEKARAFYLTHALVFALEAGDPRSEPLRRQLAEMGREA